MASLNKALIIGRIGRDPETRYTNNGDAICSFSIACSETYKNKATGEKNVTTEWINIKAFGKLAEICAEYLKKGALVYVEGRIQTHKYTDKSGIEKYTTEIKCDGMKMLGGKTERAPEQAMPETNFIDEDIDF